MVLCYIKKWESLSLKYIIKYLWKKWHDDRICFKIIQPGEGKGWLDFSHVEAGRQVFGRSLYYLFYYYMFEKIILRLDERDKVYLS